MSPMSGSGLPNDDCLTEGFMISKSFDYRKPLITKVNGRDNSNTKVTVIDKKKIVFSNNI